MADRRTTYLIAKIIFATAVLLLMTKMQPAAVSAGEVSGSTERQALSEYSMEPCEGDTVVPEPEEIDTVNSAAEAEEKTDITAEKEQAGEKQKLPETTELPENTELPESAEEEEILLTNPEDTAGSGKPGIAYSTHVQTYGWTEEKANGEMSGTTGEAKRLEAIKIHIDGDADLGITYQTHVQTYGWMDWVKAGSISGTEGKSKRLEAIRIRLTGKDQDRYDIYYCVHVQTYGWMDWVKNGEVAGTEGQGKRLEGICIMLVKKGDPVPIYPGSTETSPGKPSVCYRVHAQTYGWMKTVADGAAAGTQGESKRLEALVIELKNAPYPGSIQYQSHIQSIGWEPAWHNAGDESGTTGAAKRLEAVRIRLTDEMAEHFDIYYRTHVQMLGWLGWAKNGEEAGSEGLSYRIEALQICLAPKGAPAPGSVQGAFRSFTSPDLSSINSAGGEKSIVSFGGFTLSKNLKTELQKAIDSAQKGDLNVGFIMMDIRTGQGVAYNADERFYGASTIKAFYIPAVVYSNPSSISKWEQHMKGILQQSNNYSYELLRQEYGPGPIQAWAARAGISLEGIDKSLYSWYSARDLAKLWLVNYSYFSIGGTAETVASWMQNPSQSILKPVLGSKYRICSKGGWKSSPEKAFNDAGIVYAGNGPYVIALMSDYPGMRESGLYGIVEALDECHNAIGR